MNRNLIPVILLIFLVACDFSTKNSTYPLYFSDATMGTRYTIKVSAIPASLNKDELISRVKSRLDKIDGKMSTYRIDSELSIFNQSASSQWQDVSNSLFKVLKEAKRINELTGGAFDITVAPLVNLWGFGSDPMTYSVPADEVIKKELKKTGSDYLKINEETQQIKKEIPGLHLDLSAIAKGFAVDRVAELLEQNGIVDYMVEIGGELRLKGKNILNRPWRIAIEKPDALSRAIQKVLPLSDIAMATSGDYRNYFEVDNVRFSHTRPVPDRSSFGIEML